MTIIVILPLSVLNVSVLERLNKKFMKIAIKILFSLLMFYQVLNCFDNNNYDISFDFSSGSNFAFGDGDISFGNDLSEFDDLIDINNNINYNDFSFVTRASGDKDELILKILNAATKIKTPLWKTTKPPKGRDILYLLPYKISTIEYGGLNLNIFFNYTNKMPFSPDETLKLDENKDALDEFVQVLTEEVSSAEASSLIPLFKKLTIQERKAGALFEGGFTKGVFSFQLNTSFQISARNFWLSKKDRERIQNIFKDKGTSFDDKELYKIKLGMGDTRLKIGMNTLNTDSFQMDVGFEGIISTSKISNVQRLKSYNINFNNFEDEIPEILKSIRDNLLTPRLGNNGHFGLGCFIETKAALFHKSIHLWNRLSFDNLFAAKEDRLIPSKQTIPAPADNQANFFTNIVAPANATPADNEPATNFIKQYLFPPAYRVTIKPGGILNFISNLSFGIGKNWDVGIGYDYYLQQREMFTDIHNTNIDITSLRISDADSPSAVQHKIFTQANYLKEQNHNKWTLRLGFGGDYTISAKRIGHDWTIFLRLGASF